jgi:HAD superfamily hydrolase (TIGR01509 family)
VFDCVGSRERRRSEVAVRACIFDFDGTLADSMWVWTAIGKEFIEEFNVEPFEGFSERLAQLGLEAGAVYFVERYGLEIAPADLTAHWVAEANMKYATEVWLKPNAEEFLENLKAAGIQVAVATAQQRSPLEAALTNNGVLELFDAVVPCDEVTDTGKSTPEIYLATARMLGLDPSECIVFEDVLGPAEQAHIGGFRVVGVYDDSPAQDHDALRAECDAFIENYNDAMEKLAFLFGSSD